MKLPVMTLTQAKQLAGKQFTAGGKSFVFDDDIKAGGQAIAIPLKDSAGNRVAFFRSLFAMAMTPAKIERMAWMIGQRLHLLSEAFLGAPQLWINTETQGRPSGVDFDFAGAIHGLAQGSSWKSWKEDVEMGQRDEPGTALRLQFAKGLLLRLACLEAVGSSGFIHGDISDANVMLDEVTGKVNLIDFDCFVFESPTLQKPKLMIREGGSKGTPGYIPDWFCEKSSPDLAPLGDRFARDMLLIEFLGFREGDPIDLSPLYWTEQEDLLDDIKTMASSLNLDHLRDMSVFETKESERPSSFELANKLGLPVENNVNQTLSSPPMMPFDIAADMASERVKSERATNRTVETGEKMLELKFPTIPKVEELPGVILSKFDQAAILIGKQLLPLIKMVAVGLLGIAATVLWILLLVYLMLRLSLPANLIVCGLQIYLTVVAINRNQDWLQRFIKPG